MDSEFNSTTPPVVSYGHLFENETLSPNDSAALMVLNGSEENTKSSVDKVQIHELESSSSVEAKAVGQALGSGTYGADFVREVLKTADGNPKLDEDPTGTMVHAFMSATTSSAEEPNEERDRNRYIIHEIQSHYPSVPSSPAPEIKVMG